MLKIGIICPSEIAFRRFMPSLEKIEGIEFVGLGVPTVDERFGKDIPDEEIANKIIQEERDKALAHIDQFGGKIFEGYSTIASSSEIDALYIPLPPALHFQWAKFALENGKHVLVEKPSTISASNSAELVKIARSKGLALHENYMFQFHEQLKVIKEIVDSGEIGDVRLYRLAFGFPKRAAGDFRYLKALGGGSLLDAGGYTVKYATMLLGETAKIAYSQLNYTDEYDVDLYGSAAMVNDQGTVAQLAFGMDNNYKNELEVWGSEGTIYSGRVLTAPEGFIPNMIIRKGNEEEDRNLPADDTFAKSIKYFLDCIFDEEIRNESYQMVVKQAEMIGEFYK